MKFVPDINGHDIPISNEEYKVYETVINKTYVITEDLNERNHSLADNLVKRGVLRKVKVNEKMAYAKVRKGK